MGGDDNGTTVFLAQHLIKELAALCIKAEIGFVEKHDFAAGSYGKDESHRRLLPAGQGRIGLGRYVEANQQLIETLLIPTRPARLTNDAQLSDAPGIRQWVINPHQNNPVKDRLLVKGLFPEDRNTARLDLASDFAQERGFANAVGAN